MMKKLLKFSGLFILCLIPLTLLIGTLVFFFLNVDEELNPKITAFFYETPAEKDNNTYIALLGLNAPSGTTDIYAHGLKSFEVQQKSKCETFWEEEQELEKNALMFSSSETTAETFYNNNELITRYQTLYQYTPKPYGSLPFLPFPGKEILAINDVLNSYRLDLANNGRYEKAIQEWQDETLFLQSLLGQKHTFVTHAILMIAYGRNLAGIQDILIATSNIDGASLEKIDTALKYYSNSKRLWENIMRSEFEIIQTLEICGARNFSRNFLRDLGISDEHAQLTEPVMATNWMFSANITYNDFYDWAQDFINASQKPAKDFNKTLASMDKKYSYKSDGLGIFGPNIIGRFLLQGFYKGFELVGNAHKVNAQQAMLRTYIRARQQGITPEAMPDFLSTSEQELYNPFTQSAFEWDSEKQSIFYSYNKNRHDIEYAPSE